ncbi:MAG: hypothetical protein K6A63_00650 [Acholeplasmatales bacterium]|nr:hypothetical protein [Acholeplasmatales bacterium]
MKKRLLSIAAMGVVAAAAFVTAASVVEAKTSDNNTSTTALAANNRRLASSNSYSAGTKLFEEADATLSVGNVGAKKVTSSRWGSLAYTYEDKIFNTAYVSQDQNTASDGFTITADAGTTIGLYFTVSSSNLNDAYGTLYFAEPNNRNNAEVYASYDINPSINFRRILSWIYVDTTAYYMEYTFEEADTVALKTSTNNVVVFGFEEVDGNVNRIAEAEAAINAIGTVTYSDESAALIEAAKNAIAKVNDASEISNIEDYNNAVATYNAYVAADEAEALAAEELIAALGDAEYTEEYAEKLAAAEAQLAKVEKITVSNTSVLETAKNNYASLKEAAIADFNSKAALAAACEASDELGAKIEEAEAAYALILDADKDLVVDSYASLETAKATYEEYLAAKAYAAEVDELILALGDAEYTEDYVNQLAVIAEKLEGITTVSAAYADLYAEKVAAYNELKDAAIADFTSLVEEAASTEVSRATGCMIAKAEAAYEGILAANQTEATAAYEDLQAVIASYDDYMTDEQVVATCLAETAATMSEDYVMSDQVTLLNVTEIAEKYVKADGVKLTLDLTSTITMTVVPESNTFSIYDENGELVDTLEVTGGTIEFTLTAGTYTVVPADTPVDFYAVKVVNELGFDTIEMYSEIYYSTSTGKAYITYVATVLGVNGLVDLNDYTINVNYGSGTIVAVPTKIETSKTTHAGVIFEAQEDTYYFVYVITIRPTAIERFVGVEWNTFFSINGVDSDVITNTFIEAE